MAFYKIENDVTFLVKTFERKESLRNLLYSIFHYFPRNRIVIVDDSKNPYQKSILSEFTFLNIEYLVLPYDSGVSIGRQYGLERITSEFFVLCDDDFIINNDFLKVVYQYIKSSGLDIIGGVYIDTPSLGFKCFHSLKSLVTLRFSDVGRFWKKCNERKYEGFLTQNGDIDRFLTDSERRIDFMKCDFVSNFFLANTKEVLLLNGWRGFAKMHGEHLGFFARMKEGGLEVRFCRNFTVLHKPIFSPFYILMRYVRQRRT